MSSPLFFRRAIAVLSDRERLTRVLRRYRSEYSFRRLALRSPPVAVLPHGDITIHVLFGRTRVLNAVATLKSLYRFLPEPFALMMHDDGTLTSSDVALVRAHFPGVRVISRSEADENVLGEFRRRALPRCAALREQLILSLKLFDFQYYSRGQRVLLIDTDILFHRPPTHLVNALHQPSSHWVDRYNEDLFSAYAWSERAILEHVGVQVLPRVNSGMLCVRRGDLEWSFYEECLAIPNPTLYLVEQTLTAIDMSRRGGRPLPSEYDVAFRHTYWGDYWQWVVRAPTGHEVVAQHYCGSMLHRYHYHDDYVRHVAPALATAR